MNVAVIQQQGLITEAGYEEQANSYLLQQQAAGVAAQAQQVAAAGETQAASEYQTEANLYGEPETGDWISGAISGVAGVAELAGSAGLGPLAPVATAAVAAARLIGTRLTTSIKLVEICSVPFVTTANAATE